MDGDGKGGGRKIERKKERNSFVIDHRRFSTLCPGEGQNQLTNNNNNNHKSLVFFLFTTIPIMFVVVVVGGGGGNHRTVMTESERYSRRE